MSKVLVLFNPISGGGRGQKLANEVRLALLSAGFEPLVESSQRAYPAGHLERALQSSIAAVVVGGDGTMRPLLRQLADSGVPVTMVPAGNESLFCRVFGMTTDPAHVVERIRGGSIEEHWFGLAGDEPFFSMVSVGLDSAVVWRISRTRRGPIGTKGYVLPTLVELSSFRAPNLSLMENGVQLFAGPAYVIAANTKEYARRLNPVPDADSRRPELAVRVFPGLGRAGYARMLLRLAAGMGLPAGAGIGFKGSSFEIASGEPYPVQADGDAIGHTPLSIRISAKPVRVLHDRAPVSVGSSVCRTQGEQGTE